MPVSGDCQKGSGYGKVDPSRNLLPLLPGVACKPADGLDDQLSPQDSADDGGSQLAVVPGELWRGTIAAVALPAVTAAANPKQSAAAWCDAKSLTESNFSCLCHPRLKARLDISRRSWQPKAVWLDNSRKRVSDNRPGR